MLYLIEQIIINMQNTNLFSQTFQDNNVAKIFINQLNLDVCNQHFIKSYHDALNDILQSTIVGIKRHYTNPNSKQSSQSERSTSECIESLTTLAKNTPNTINDIIKWMLEASEVIQDDLNLRLESLKGDIYAPELGCNEGISEETPSSSHIQELIYCNGLILIKKDFIIFQNNLINDLENKKTTLLNRFFPDDESINSSQEDSTVKQLIVKYQFDDAKQRVTQEYNKKSHVEILHQSQETNRTNCSIC